MANNELVKTRRQNGRIRTAAALSQARGDATTQRYHANRRAWEQGDEHKELSEKLAKIKKGMSVVISGRTFLVQDVDDAGLSVIVIQGSRRVPYSVREVESPST